MAASQDPHAGQPVLQSTDGTIDIRLPMLPAEAADVAIRLRSTGQGAGLSGLVELREFV